MPILRVLQAAVMQYVQLKARNHRAQIGLVKRKGMLLSIAKNRPSLAGVQDIISELSTVRALA
jgi:hypothetical protein